MNYTVNAFEQDQNYNPGGAEELKQQLEHLAAWKSKAVVQLEYFRSACSLYKLCEIDEVNELLNHSHLIVPIS